MHQITLKTGELMVGGAIMKRKHGLPETEEIINRNNVITEPVNIEFDSSRIYGAGGERNGRGRNKNCAVKDLADNWQKLKINYSNSGVKNRLIILILLLVQFPILSRGQDVTKTNHVILISIDGLAAYHLENEELELPNLRELIDRGVWAEAARTVFPSVTHPSHATLTTGVSPRKHGVVGNRMTHRITEESYHIATKTREEAIHVRTLFDAAREAGLTTAAFCWPETRKDASVDFNILHGHDELDKAEVDPGLLEFLRQAGIPIDTYYDWAHDGRMVQGYRNVILAKSAAEVIQTHQPEFVALHFPVTDAIQHAWGSKHYLAYSALTHVDYMVGLVRQAVRNAGLEDQTTFVIAADHGFHSVYHEVNIHPVLAESGLADRVRLHGSGWSVFVEVTDYFDQERDGSALESFFNKILGLEGLERIIRPDEFHALGYPRYEENPHVPGQYIIIPNINTYLTVDSSTESTQRLARSQPYHGHGYLPDHPRMYPGLIFSGNGIRKGHRVGVVRNLDVAPTIAEILGLNMPGVEGQVLREALEQ